MAEILKTVLLTALPASGKSEVRRYLDHLPPEVCRKDLNMGPTSQLDDYPYVHLMRRVDQELQALGQGRAYFVSEDRSFRNPADWGTLIGMVNADYADMVGRVEHDPAGAAELLFTRLDAASKAAGAEARLSKLDAATRSALAERLDAEAKDWLKSKRADYPDTLEGRTLVIEFSRGGPTGTPMPLPAPYGYRHSLSLLSPEILSQASILYIWVTPEESRRKNQARARPDGHGSILHHGVPEEVMLGEYGCDDMDWWIHDSDRPGTVRLEAHGRVFHLPVGRFDNRVDKTSFLRADRADWTEAQVQAVHQGLREAFDQLNSR